MAVLRLFAAAREAAGTHQVIVEGKTVGEVLDRARAEFGDEFRVVLENCRVWVDGEPAAASDAVGARSEVAVLPPVSGGQ